MKGQRLGAVHASPLLFVATNALCVYIINNFCICLLLSSPWFHLGPCTTISCPELPKPLQWAVVASTSALDNSTQESQRIFLDTNLINSLT